MNRKLKNILIIILFLAIIGMAIGYAALSQLLTINGTATYIVTVENAGTIDAMLESINGIDTANKAEPLDVTFNINANENDVLNSGATKDYTVTVKWLETASTIPNTKEKTATITLNYVQVP